MELSNGCSKCAVDRLTEILKVYRHIDRKKNVCHYILVSFK